MQNNRVVAVLLKCMTIKDNMKNNVEQNFALQFIVFWLRIFKLQILVNALLVSEAAFWMRNPIIALIILYSATNVSYICSKWLPDKVVELFRDCASVVSVTIQSSNSIIFVEKHRYHSFIRGC